MSLYRQLWLAIVACMALAFCGSMAISALGARSYLEQQLGAKNADGAQALALSMSQLPKDAATLELQVATLFEQGQYERIRVLDDAGRVVVEQAEPPRDHGWLGRVLPIAAAPGRAEIADGPRRFGTVELASIGDGAYAQLERIARRLLAGFALAAIATGLLASWVVRRIRTPLARVVGQASAIAERRFVTIDEPAVPELRQVVRAMNDMVLRLRAIFDEEAARLAALRREASEDALTGLATRAHFMARAGVLLDDDADGGGVLVLLRLRELASLNRSVGRAEVDALLQRVARVLDSERHPSACAGRLNGSDMALALPHANDARALARQLLAGAAQAAPQATLAVAAVAYTPGEPLATVLARADNALARAENGSGNSWAVAEDAEEEFALPSDAWRAALVDAIAARRVRLARFPTRRQDGSLLQSDCLARLDPSQSGEWLPAGRFLPYVARFGLHADLDLVVAGLVFESIAADGSAHALTLSGASVASADFQEALLARLDRAGAAVAPLLRVEVDEDSAFRHLDAFARLVAQLHARGAQAGIKHFGRAADSSARLHPLGLDYVKVDASLVRGLAPGQEHAYLGGLCAMLHELGCLVLAEGVQHRDELAALPALGFDGATGPALQS